LRLRFDYSLAHGLQLSQAALFAALAESGAAEERVQMLDSTTVRAHQPSTGAKGRGAIRSRAAA
jgi:hypothetical protein